MVNQVWQLTHEINNFNNERIRKDVLGDDLPSYSKEHASAQVGRKLRLAHSLTHLFTLE